MGSNIVAISLLHSAVYVLLSIAQFFYTGSCHQSPLNSVAYVNCSCALYLGNVSAKALTTKAVDSQDVCPGSNIYINTCPVDFMVKMCSRSWLSTQGPICHQQRKRQVLGSSKSCPTCRKLSFLSTLGPHCFCTRRPGVMDGLGLFW